MTEDTPTTKTSASSEFDTCEKEGKRLVMTMMKEKKQNWRSIQEGLLPRLLALSHARGLEQVQNARHEFNYV